MSGTTLYGLCACALVGLGLYGLICQGGTLRRVLAFNLIGNGVFLLFGVIARRGGGVLALAGTGRDGDPLPQALVITGLVVAFAATAIAVALGQRLAVDRGPDTPKDPAPPLSPDDGTEAAP